MNKKNINVLVNKSAGPDSYINLLNERYNVIVIDAFNYNNEKLDLVLFTGGEDVDPGYYNENKGKFTGVNKSRDDKESRYMFYPEYTKNVPKLGICRGSQFLTVMSGASLIQHVNGHAIGQLHPIIINGIYDNLVVDITSTHHQMMFPYSLPKDNYEIIGTSSKFLSNTYLNGNDKEKELPINFEECEIVYYKNTNSLCIQGHPEMAHCPDETKNICLDIIDHYLKL